MPNDHERDAELTRRLDEADKRVTAYEAGIRAQAARNREKSHDAG